MERGGSFEPEEKQDEDEDEEKEVLRRRRERLQNPRQRQRLLRGRDRDAPHDRIGVPDDGELLEDTVRLGVGSVEYLCVLVQHDLAPVGTAGKALAVRADAVNRVVGLGGRPFGWVGWWVGEFGGGGRLFLCLILCLCLLVSPTPLPQLTTPL